MSDTLITGGASGCRPWQFASFDGKAGGRVTLPTAAQLERVHQQSREEGYAAGYREGRQRAAQEAQRIAQLAAGFEGALAQMDGAVGEPLLRLALDIARAMLNRALEIRPELVLPVVQEAVRALPHTVQSLRVYAHPDDVRLLEAALASRAAGREWKVIADAATERGGCRIETATTEIDATLSGRWQRVLDALGADGRWLQP